ncbi:MAG: methylenetetrahydrofolate reductase [Actinobacteria bacterium]|nr:methylenetetrahydrofolate reductase [Actinomycetota bacterium]
MSDRLTTSPSFEIIPLKGIEEKLSALPSGASVTVTASPAKGTKATLDLAAEVHRLGHETTPHLSARMIADQSELNDVIDRLAGEGINRVFVVGGDADEQGKFKDALELLRAMEELGHHFQTVGITGYPEGHPFISGDQLRQALIDKQRHATYIATQMCFDPRAIVTWARGTRADAVQLPIRVGVPGVVDPLKLASIARRIGVGASARYVTKNRAAVWRLLRPKTYRPTKLVRALEQEQDELNLAGLHIFTFNQIASTVAWLRGQR